MAEMQSPEHPLEVLPAMLNLVLLQTSKILRDPNAQNLRQTGLTRGRITGIVNTASQRFHEALDEIEVEILHAKAVMERDLRNIRRKRAERDRARDRANGIPTPSSLPKEMDENTQQPDGVHVNDEHATEDMPQNQVADGENDIPIDEQDDSDRAKTNEDKVIDTGRGMPQDSEHSAGLAITMSPDPTSTSQEQSKNNEQQSADGTNAAEVMMDTSDAANVDFFESMFNDDDLVNADDTMSFGEFNFSIENTASQAHPNDSTLQNTTINNIDTNNVTSTSNEDINSLLPGLENYVTGSDFSTVGMPVTSTQPESAQSTKVAPSGAPAADVHTNFDDDFFGLNFDMNDTGGDDMGDGGFGDLDNFDWN